MRFLASTSTCQLAKKGKSFLRLILKPQTGTLSLRFLPLFSKSTHTVSAASSAVPGLMAWQRS